MKNARHFLLFCMILTGCKTPSEYFGRRTDIVPAINNQCTAFRNGIEIDATNFISIEAEKYDYLMEYYDEHEYFHFVCKKYGRCD